MFVVLCAIIIEAFARNTPRKSAITLFLGVYMPVRPRGTNMFKT